MPASKNFRLHDLRHCFASAHAMAGSQQRSLQALLRHRDTRMTMRYSHLTDGFLRESVDRVNIGGKPAYPRPNPPDRWPESQPQILRRRVTVSDEPN